MGFHTMYKQKPGKRQLLEPLSGPALLERRRKAGFTLLELVLALAILGLAVTLMLSLFFRSTELGDTVRNRTLAAELAETQLAAILATPEYFTWRLPADRPLHALGSTALFPVTPLGSEAGPDETYPWRPPSVLPVQDAQAAQDTARYEQFRWRAFVAAPGGPYAAYPTPGYAYLELSVAVQWEEAGRTRQWVYTSAVPLERIPREQRHET